MSRLNYMVPELAEVVERIKARYDAQFPPGKDAYRAEARDDAGRLVTVTADRPADAVSTLLRMIEKDDPLAVGSDGYWRVVKP